MCRSFQLGHSHITFAAGAWQIMALSKNSLVLLLIAVLNSVDAFAPSCPALITRQTASSQRIAVALSDETNTDEEISDIDSPAPEDYIVNVGDLEGEDEEDGALDDGEPPAWYVSQQRVNELRLEHRRHDTDTGSPEYQVAGMTERITYLTKHLKVNPKDFSTRRGLVALVNKRRRLLNYLHREDENRYSALVTSLGVRHKAPSRVEDKNEKYGRYPPQKAVKKHLK